MLFAVRGIGEKGLCRNGLSQDCYGSRSDHRKDIRPSRRPHLAGQPPRSGARGGRRRGGGGRGGWEKSKTSGTHNHFEHVVKCNGYSKTVPAARAPPEGRSAAGRSPGWSKHQAATAQMHLAETNIVECRPLLEALPPSPSLSSSGLDCSLRLRLRHGQEARQHPGLSLARLLQVQHGLLITIIIKTHNNNKC